MSTYKPTPLDTREAVLPDALNGLLEQLAENAHEVWAAKRLSDGWKFGPRRNDADKEHPCLVPYADLPESEKEYDRIAAAETLKAIIVAGYTIVAPK